MKKNDLALIISTMFISAVLAVLVTSTLLSNSVSKQQPVTVVNTINTSFQPPSNQYLNSNSIDPTLLVKIGNNSNTAPFIQ
jgi:hypothetical protein